MATETKKLEDAKEKQQQKLSSKVNQVLYTGYQKVLPLWKS